MDLSKRINETELDYHKRIVYGKLVDKTLLDVDYTELAELIYGQPYSSDVARRMFYGSKRTLDLLTKESVDACDNGSLLGELDAKIIELRKERQKFFDQRAAFNKVVRDRSRQEELNEIISNVVRAGSLPELMYEPRIVERSNNDLLVSLNDIHYGAAHTNYWGEYNSDICRAMMCKYISQIIDIANTHGSENCIIWENGDAISGSIHRSIQVSNKENVIEQVMGVSELIAQFIASLSEHFNNISFISVSGNHSRLDANKENAITSERLDDLISWYLKARLQNFDNVKIITDRIDPTMYLINIRGKNYCGIHGDYDFSEKNIQALSMMLGKPLYAILSGHKHHNSVGVVQGVKTVMAGSFLGMDDYCITKRILGHPQQMICVCDSNGIRCHYDVDLRLQAQA